MILIVAPESNVWKIALQFYLSLKNVVLLGNDAQFARKLVKTLPFKIVFLSTEINDWEEVSSDCLESNVACVVIPHIEFPEWKFRVYGMWKPTQENFFSFLSSLGLWKSLSL